MPLISSVLFDLLQLYVMIFDTQKISLWRSIVTELISINPFILYVDLADLFQVPDRCLDQ